MTFSESSIDCVEKVHDRMTESALVLDAAAAMPRFALVIRHTFFCVASVNELQSAGADLMAA